LVIANRVLSSERQNKISVLRTVPTSKSRLSNSCFLLCTAVFFSWKLHWSQTCGWPFPQMEADCHLQWAHRVRTRS